MAIKSREIARISVRVLPDLEHFRERLKAELEWIENNIKGEIEFHGDFHRGSLVRDIRRTIREINAENRALPSRWIRFHGVLDDRALRDRNGHTIHVRLSIDEESRRHTEEQLARFQQRWNPIETEIRPDIASAAARYVSMRMSWLSRDRIAKIIPWLDKAAMMKVITQFATAMAALSGARMVHTIFDGFVRSILSLDKAIPLLGAVALGFGGIAASIGVVISNMVVFGQGLTQIIPLALVLPGIFAGLMAMAIGTATAFGQMKKMAPYAADAGILTRDAFIQAFYQVSGLEQTFIRFFERLRGVTNAFGATLGSWWKAFLETLMAPGIWSMFTGIMNNINAAMNVSIGGMNDLVRGILALVSVGASQLPRFMGWINGLAGAFANWVDKTTANGQMQAWIEQAIFQARELGRVLAGVGRILYWIAEAAEKAGGASLTSVANTLNGIADALKRPEFQGALTNFFRGAHGFFAELTRVSGPAFYDLLASIGNWAGTALPKIGQALGWLVKGLSDGLNTNAFFGGINSFLDSLMHGLQVIQPALKTVGPLFGNLATIAGILIDNFAPLINVVMKNLADLLSRAMPSLERIVSALSGALLPALETLLPILVDGIVWGLEKFADLLEWLAPLIATAREELVQWVQGIDFQKYFDNLTNAFDNADVAGMLGGFKENAGRYLAGIWDIMAPDFTNLFTTLQTEIPKLVPTIMPLVQAVAKDIGPVLGHLLGTAAGILGPIISLIQPILAIFVGFITPIIEAIRPLVSELQDNLSPAFSELAAAIKPFLEEIKPVTDVLGGIIAVVAVGAGKLLIESLVAIMTGLTNFFNGVNMFIEGWKTVITAISEGDLGGIVEGLTGALGGFGGIVVGIVQAFLPLQGGITGVTDGLLQAEGPVAKVGEFFDTMRMRVWEAIARFGDALIRGVGYAASWAAGIWEHVRRVPEYFRNGLSEAHRQTEIIWNGFMGWLGGAVSRLNQAMSGAWNGVRNTVIGAVSGLVETARNNLNALFSFVANGAEGMRKGFVEGIGRLHSGAQQRFEEVLSWFRSAPTRMKNAMGDVGGTLYGIGRSILQGLINGINSRFGDVRRFFETLTNLIPDWKGPYKRDKVLLTGAGEAIMDSLLNGLESKYDGIKKSLQGFTGDLADAVVNPMDGLIKNGEVQVRVASGSNLNLSGSTDAAYNTETVKGAGVVKQFIYNAQPTSVMPEDDFFRATERMRLADR